MDVHLRVIDRGLFKDGDENFSRRYRARVMLSVQAIHTSDYWVLDGLQGDGDCASLTIGEAREDWF